MAYTRLVNEHFTKTVITVQYLCDTNFTEYDLQTITTMPDKEAAKINATYVPFVPKSTIFFTPAKAKVDASKLPKINRTDKTFEDYKRESGYKEPKKFKLKS